MTTGLDDFRHFEANMADHQKEIEEFGINDDFWLFGYGSLIWKPPPHFDQRVPGYIEGYVRRFWQASEDHRGTPEAPGRVVTLIDKAHWDTLTDHHEPAERVWGAAYHIPSKHVAEVREYLDIREINGYSIQFTPFHPAPSTTSTATSFPARETGPGIRKTSTAEISYTPTSAIKCLVYIGLPSNPQFLGPQDPDELARKILESNGPSGENKEYLYMLETALRGLGRGGGDKHVQDLVRRCRVLEEGDGEDEEED
ncbi:gamma-glutamylcyclotransferase [Parastagonospora nodorum]|nr:gamma-glutamylcyclotransferase [Parastagonospora nodorum]KAH4317304.1 gamma-glutamylcyclotransferase [Parastagonospora nodorum]KAH4326750.1 gamma-glutamylcyclotransferase [Parastagonospora nodorum]KAH4388603.1 gamma-glutamylcyclotransferase [Parastagonospora nodorum]KAH4405852.1 gamma-glutamylcyclotransferase [Parastagonospora nodorum]